MSAITWTFPRGGHTLDDVTGITWTCTRCGLQHYGTGRTAFYVTPCAVPHDLSEMEEPNREITPSSSQVACVDSGRTTLKEI